MLIPHLLSKGYNPLGKEDEGSVPGISILTKSLKDRTVPLYRENKDTFAEITEQIANEHKQHTYTQQILGNSLTGASGAALRAFLCDTFLN